jgi:hypothetical protein
MRFLTFFRDAKHAKKWQRYSEIVRNSWTKLRGINSTLSPQTYLVPTFTGEDFTTFHWVPSIDNAAHHPIHLPCGFFSMFYTRWSTDFGLNVMLIASPQIHNREDIIAGFLTGGSLRHMTRNYSHVESRRGSAWNELFPNFTRREWPREYLHSTRVGKGHTVRIS